MAGIRSQESLGIISRLFLYYKEDNLQWMNLINTQHPNNKSKIKITKSIFQKRTYSKKDIRDIRLLQYY